jgi:hypothetical protein
VREIKMNEIIENEIVKLIQEIRENEEALTQLEAEAKVATREVYSKNKYASKLKSCKDSLNRKISLLRSLRK